MPYFHSSLSFGVVMSDLSGNPKKALCKVVDSMLDADVEKLIFNIKSSGNNTYLESSSKDLAASSTSLASSSDISFKIP